MTRYAKINLDNIVENTIVCDDSQISLFQGNFIKITETTGDCSIGDLYLLESSKFIPPKPYESWVLDESFNWVSPIGENPNPAIKYWDEETQSWLDR